MSIAPRIRAISHHFCLTVFNAALFPGLCVLREEACHESKILDDVLELAGKSSLDVNIPGEKHTLRTDPLTILYLVILLSGDEDLRNQVLQTVVLYLLFDILFGFFLFTACGTDNIPFLGNFAHNYNW